MVKKTKLENIFNPYKNIKKELYFLCKDLLLSKQGITFKIPYQALECFVTFNRVNKKQIFIGFNQTNAIRLKMREKGIAFQKNKNPFKFDVSTCLEDKSGFTPMILQDDYGPDWEENKSVFTFPLFTDEKIKINVNNKCFVINMDNVKKHEQKIFEIIKQCCDNKEYINITVHIKNIGEIRKQYESHNILFKNTNTWFEDYQNHIKEEKLAYPFFYSSKDELNFFDRHGMSFEDIKSVGHIIKNHINNDVSYNLELLDLELKFDAFSHVEIADIEKKYRDFNKLYKNLIKQLKN